MSETNAPDSTRCWECLNQWHQVVQHVLRKGRAPRGITEEGYIRLHRDLLSLVQVTTQDRLTPGDQLRQALHHSVRPWVNLESLSRCDRRVLRMLEEEVRLARNQLVPRQHGRRQNLYRLATALIVLLMIVVILGMFSTGGVRAMNVAGGLDKAWQFLDGARAQLWLGVVQSSANQRLVALAGAIVVVGIFFLRDPKRS